jgi:hypothetical protein
MMLPVAVEPVKEIAATSGVVDDGRARRALAVHQVDDAPGDAGLLQDLHQELHRVRHVLARLDHHRVPAHQRGNIFQVGMASGKLKG